MLDTHSETGNASMDLRTPAPLSDDEIYGFAENAQPMVPGSAPAARNTNLGIDVSAAPRPRPRP